VRRGIGFRVEFEDFDFVFVRVPGLILFDFRVQAYACALRADTAARFCVLS